MDQACGMIKTRREALGWPRRRLAERSGVTERTIINIEHGVNVPRAATLAKLDQALAEGESMFRGGALGP